MHVPRPSHYYTAAAFIAHSIERKHSAPDELTRLEWKNRQLIFTAIQRFPELRARLIGLLASHRQSPKLESILNNVLVQS